jgi:hypothetical protein
MSESQIAVIVGSTRPGLGGRAAAAYDPAVSPSPTR